MHIYEGNSHASGILQQMRRCNTRLFSNRKAGDDLFLTATGRIDAGKTSPDVLEQIEAQLGDNAHDFIARFHFEVNEQGLADLKERLQREFQSLGLPESNWLGFMDAVRSWIRCESLPPPLTVREGHFLPTAYRSRPPWRPAAIIVPVWLPHAALIPIYWDRARPVRLPLPIIPGINDRDVSLRWIRAKELLVGGSQ